MIEAIKNFFSLVVDEYIYLACSIILVLVVTVFLSIVLHSKKKRQRAKLKQEEFKYDTLHSLTLEEIDNISNNSANPEEVKQYLTNEAEETITKPAPSAENKKSSKPAPSAENKKSSKPAKQIKVKIDEVKDTQPKKKAQPKTKKVEIETVKDANKPTKNTVKLEKEEAPKITKKVAQSKAKAEASKIDVSNAKATPTKNIAKTANVKTEPVPKKQYTGKWKIVQDDDGYYAVLTASNGGTLLQTEKYRSITNVKNGIETIKKNVDSGNFAISIDKYGHYHFKLFNLSNRLICMSEDYSSKAKCESGIESVKRFAKTASIIQEDK